VAWDFLPRHPLKSVRRAKGADNSRTRYLSAVEEQRLRKALDDREAERRASRERHNAWHAARATEGHPQWPDDGYTDHLMPLVLLGLNTGLRRGEMLGLRWENIDFNSAILTVPAGIAKSRKGRHVPLNTEALAVLDRWRRQTPGDDVVFPGAGGGRMTHINTSWEGLVEAVKLKDFRFHDLRHDFASKLVMAGVDLNTVRELLGHSDIKMTLRYAHLAPQKLADAVAKLRGSA
jgi:integrase